MLIYKSRKIGCANMEKILKIIVLIITIILIKEICLLEEVAIPIFGYGKIIFYRWLATACKGLFIVLVLAISVFLMICIKYMFRGAKIREIKNKNTNGIKNSKKRHEAINEKRDFVEEEVVSDEYLLDKYSDFKELLLLQNGNEIVKKIKELDLNFNNVLFVIKAYEFSKELIKTKIVKQTSVEYVYKAFNAGIVNVRLPYFYSFEKLDEYYVLKLRVDESKKKKSINEDGIEIDDISIYTYELTFVKSEKDGVKSRKCPRCGAPLKENTIGICDYCFKYNDKEGKNKIKSNVSKFSYDIPIIKFPKVIPKVCENCGATLKKELKGHCEYCNNENNSDDNEWVLVEFEEIN